MISPPDFKALFESSPTLYLVMSPELILVAASDAYLRSTMRTRDEILGRHIFDAFPDNPDDAEATGVSNLRASIERVLTTHEPDTMAVQKYDIPRPEAAGGGFEERFWSPIHSPVFGEDGEISYIIQRVQDVTEFIRARQQSTEQQKLAEALQSRAEQMESEIYQRAQEVQEANSRLRSAHDRLSQREREVTQLYERLFQLDQLKTQLFANVSHELRTPLALILGQAQRLLAESELNSAQRHDVQGIDRNARILLKHVNDLLDVAKLESGKMTASYQQVDLARLVRQTASHFESHALEHTVRYTVEAPEVLPAQVDPDKIQRVLMNLLSNAFKFTPVGGSVRCVLSAANGMATIVAADSGPGIAQAMRENVFERFFQAEESSTRRFGGTGLGLAIAKDFIELHGGSITVGDAPEGGALLTVELPLLAPAGAAVHAASSDAEPYAARIIEPHASPEQMPDVEPRLNDSRPLILVVEDHPEMSRFIRETLARDYRTESAFNGRQGLEKALELLPDLILSDVMMPGVSGAQMVDELRNHDALADVPILMLTAKADDDLRVQLLREGAQDYLLKPFVAEELRARVNNLVALKRAQEQLVVRNQHLNAAVSELENANRELDAFSYSVSHDLRAPLRAIHGFSEMLSEEVGDSLDGDARHYLARIQHNVLNAQGMIDALISLARLGRQPLTKELIETVALVQEVLQDLAAEQKGRQVEFRVGDLPACEADPKLLRHVYTNLIANALKYTRKREHAVIEIDSMTDAGKTVYFVRDNGAGFDMTYADKLFSVFQRLHRPDEFEGTGIGLATVRRIVNRHGGRIWADAGVDRGATFFFELSSG